MARLVDGTGDPVANAEVTIESPTSGASAWLYDAVSGPLTTLVTQTDANGIVTVYPVANGEGGCYGVTVTHPNASAVGWQLGNIWYASIFANGFELTPAERLGIPVCEPD